MQSYVSKIRILSYKCFREAEALLGPGLNVVIGKNDAGKSALLQALSLRFAPIPHKGPATIDIAPQSLPPSEVIVHLTADGYDPFADLTVLKPTESWFHKQFNGSHEKFLQWLEHLESYEFVGFFNGNGECSKRSMPTLNLGGHPKPANEGHLKTGQ